MNFVYGGLLVDDLIFDYYFQIDWGLQEESRCVFRLHWLYTGCMDLMTAQCNVCWLFRWLDIRSRITFHRCVRLALPRRWWK